MDAKVISGAREISRAALLDRAARAAAALESLGIGEGDAVAIYLRNDFAFYEASLAATTLGAYAAPINWHYTAAETGYILRDCAAGALIVHADLLPDIAAGIPDGLPVLVVDTPPEIAAAYGLPEIACRVPPNAIGWSRWIETFAPWTGAPRPPRLSMIYTSGTTGRPKGVRREAVTPEQLKLMSAAMTRVFDVGAGAPTRTVMTGPMYHSAPNRYGLMAIRDEGLVVLQSRFDAEDLLRLIETHRITHLHMVPVMFVRLLKLPEEVRRRYDVGSLKWVIHAAAPCPPEVKRAMIEWWGPVICEYYGATEIGPVTLHDSKEALRKPGTSGKPLPGVDIRILAADGTELPAGEIGEVYCRHRAYPDFTYHGRDADRVEVERNGLITCGDVGYFDPDGYLFLCDRRRDMIISGGVNIYPAEIEAALLEMPEVRDCAVFGIPDDEFGEAICAVVEPATGIAPDVDTVRRFLRGRIARYKVPQRIEFTDALPREDSGKVFKRKLREPYWAGRGRTI